MAVVPRNVDEDLEKNFYSWTQMDVQDDVLLSLSPDRLLIWGQADMGGPVHLKHSSGGRAAAQHGLRYLEAEAIKSDGKNFEKLLVLSNMNLLKSWWELEDSDEEN